jgi:general stress protein 26
MSIQGDVSADPRGTVFEVLDGVRAGMLGLTTGGKGFQPMTHFPDADAGSIWFISSTGTALVGSLGKGEDAEYVVISRDHDAYVSLRGKLYQLHDDAKMEELWNPVVSAWFEGGRDDPQLALLRFDPEVADIWASSASTLKFGFEIIRANLDADHQPDIGARATVRFSKAA